jgi:uncharacterized membrane protein YdjX (TVP38/TMEM64 family)
MRARVLGLIALIALAIACGLSPAIAGVALRPARELARAHDLSAIVLFVLLYAIAVAAGVPGTALTLLGGAAFGFWRGIGVNLAGAMLGCTIAFFAARLAGEGAARLLLGRRGVRWLSALVGNERPFRTIARLRFMPFVPFSAVNFGAGLVRTPLGAFLAATIVGILPSTIVCTMFARELVASPHTRHASLLWLGLATLAMAVVSFAPELVTRLRRRAEPAEM